MSANDDMHRWLGAEVTSSVVLAAVAIPAHRKRASAARSRLSPDRAAAFAAPPWKSVFGDYQAAAPRHGGRGWCSTAPCTVAALIDEPSTDSHASRYSQLIDDVRNDIARFEPFFASAQRVIELDRSRQRQPQDVSELSIPPERADAIARMEE